MVMLKVCSNEVLVGWTTREGNEYCGCNTTAAKLHWPFTQEDPACNKFGCNKHLAVSRRFLCIQIIDSNGKKLRALAYNRQFLLHLLPRSKFNTDERICLLVCGNRKSKFLSGTKWFLKEVYSSEAE